MNFKHHQLVEIYSALKSGCWVNHAVKEELIQQLEQYMIRVAMHNDFKDYFKKFILILFKISNSFD